MAYKNELIITASKWIAALSQHVISHTKAMWALMAGAQPKSYGRFNLLLLQHGVFLSKPLIRLHWPLEDRMVTIFELTVRKTMNKCSLIPFVSSRNKNHIYVHKYKTWFKHCVMDVRLFSLSHMRYWRYCCNTFFWL